MTCRYRESRTIRDVTTCRREIVSTDVMNRESKRSREEIKASRQRGSAFLTWAGRSEVCLLTLSSGPKKVMMVTKQTVAKPRPRTQPACPAPIRQFRKRFTVFFHSKLKNLFLKKAGTERCPEEERSEEHMSELQSHSF